MVQAALARAGKNQPPAKTSAVEKLNTRKINPSAYRETASEEITPSTERLKGEFCYRFLVDALNFRTNSDRT